MPQSTIMNQPSSDLSNSPEQARRVRAAQQIADACPPTLCDEISLTGSTARGLADADSDLEINLWSDALPPLELRRAWLEAAGVQGIEADFTPRSDGAFHMAGWWHEGDGQPFEIEFNWQTYESMEALVASLTGDAAPSVPHRHLTVGELLTTARPLRTTGRLSAWQARLAEHSQALRDAVTGQALTLWRDAARHEMTLRLMRRGERLSLTARLIDDLNALMRLLYAINRRYEPSAKWTITLARRLPIQPDHLEARLNAALDGGKSGVRAAYELIADTLRLLTPTPERDAALAEIQRVLTSLSLPEST
jgi:hypothetical protein